MLLFAIIKLLPSLRLSRQKTELFSFFFFFLPFRVNLVLISVFRGIVLGKKHSYVHNKWAQIAFKAMKRKESVQKNAAVSDSPPDVACRKSVTSAQ